MTKQSVIIIGTNILSNGKDMTSDNILPTHVAGLLIYQKNAQALNKY